MAFSPLLMESYENKQATEFKARSRDFATVLILIGLPVATGIALVASPLAEAMIGAALREDAKNIMPWIAASGLLNGLTAFYFTESFHLSKKTKSKAILMIFPLIFNVVMNIILIPRFGLMGAVYATLLSYLLAVCLLAVWGRKYVSLPLPVKNSLFIIIACAAMFPVKYIQTDAGPWVDLIVMAVCGVIIYSAVILIFNVANIRHWLRTIVAKRA